MELRLDKESEKVCNFYGANNCNPSKLMLTTNSCNLSHLLVDLLDQLTVLEQH